MDAVEQERELFARGKQVCGAKAGGLILKLLKSKGNNVALARSVIELASTKQDPREFIAATIRKVGNGTGTGTAAAFDRLIARAEGARGTIDLESADYVDISPRAGQAPRR